MARKTPEPIETRQRGRPVEGSVIKGKDGLWRVRLTIPGTKLSKRIKLGPEIRTEARAKEVARHWHEKLRENPGLLNQASNGKALTCGQYLERWTEHRRKRLTCAEDDRSSLLLHVLDDSRLRDKPAAAVTRDDLRKVVAKLDAKVEVGSIQATTAARLWSKVRSMFCDMAESKVEKLRIREDNPVLGIRGPDKGDDRDKAILYPDEADQLLRCSAIDADARRFWAVLLYTGMRVSEVKALRWGSVDLQHREIHVHQSGDKKVKGTKTGKARTIPVVPALVPLLEAMGQMSEDGGRVFPRSFVHSAESLRAHVRAAGIKREALYATDTTRRALRAQDARASTATWLGILMQLPDAGEERVGCRVEPFMIKQWLGHEKLATTEKYYLRGKGLRVEHVGTPFGALPADLTVCGSHSCQDFLPDAAAQPRKRLFSARLGYSLRSRSGTARSRN
jgi:integrase